MHFSVLCYNYVYDVNLEQVFFTNKHKFTPHHDQPTHPLLSAPVNNSECEPLWRNIKVLIRQWQYKQMGKTCVCILYENWENNQAHSFMNLNNKYTCGLQCNGGFICCHTVAFKIGYTYLRKMCKDL